MIILNNHYTTKTIHMLIVTLLIIKTFQIRNMSFFHAVNRLQTRQKLGTKAVDFLIENSFHRGILHSLFIIQETYLYTLIMEVFYVEGTWLLESQLDLSFSFPSPRVHPGGGVINCYDTAPCGGASG